MLFPPLLKDKVSSPSAGRDLQKRTLKVKIISFMI